MADESDFIKKGLESQGFEVVPEQKEELPSNIFFEDGEGFDFQPEEEETSVLATDEPKAEGEENKEETPQAETSTETPSDLSNDDTPEQPQATETPNEEPKATEYSFDNELSQRTDGKFSTWDEVQTALDTPKEAAIPKELESLVNYFNEGGEEALKNWTKLMAVDPEGMTDTDVHKYKLQEQGYSADEIAYFLYEYEQKHNIDQEDFDLLDRGEQLKLKAEKDKFARQAREYRKEIQSKKDGLKLPERDNQAINEEKSRELAELQKKWEAKVSDNVKDFSNVTIQLPNGSDFNYEVTSDMKKKVTEIMNNPNSYWERFKGKDGQTDLNKVRTELAWAMFGSEILKSAAAQSNSNGKEEVAKDINNINFDPNNKASKPKTNPSIQEQIMNQMLGKI